MGPDDANEPSDGLGMRCRRCVHYYLTWDERAPHGCRALGFKSRRMPILVVRQTTPDLDCLLFKPRPQRR